MTKHVAVLQGGLSHEREVSLNTGKAVSDALKALGHQVTDIDVGYDVAQKLAETKPDMAFNALHGTYGEDGCIQGLLEFLRIPYTHSGVRASALAMHKMMAFRLFESAGIRCPGGTSVTREDVLASDVISRPYVVKPVEEGSSVGVLIVHEGDAIDGDAESFPQSKELMVEPYIDGREFTVGVLDGQALGTLEIRPKEGFYDYRNKYTAGMTEYLQLEEGDAALQKEAEELAVKAHRVLGCRGVSRADFRCDGKGRLYMLEVNTHPGMTSTSLVPKMAQHQGMSFEALVEALLVGATLDHA